MEKLSNLKTEKILFRVESRVPGGPPAGELGVWDFGPSPKD
jgi:hypothetical protein